MTLTRERLHELMRYDAELGALLWRDPLPRATTGPVGSRAGVGGRLQVRIDGRAQYVHRLIWLYHCGKLPTRQVDHVNGDKCDNRIENLRLATNAENRQNVNQFGVSFDTRKAERPWRARIMVDGKSISLGYFDTCAEARAEYLRAKHTYHPTFTTGVGSRAA